MTSIVTRIRVLNAIADDDRSRAHLKSDSPRLKRCARLISRALGFSGASGLVTICVVIFAFVGALAKWQHETAVALLFMLALALLAVTFGVPIVRGHHLASRLRSSGLRVTAPSR